MMMNKKLDPRTVWQVNRAIDEPGKFDQMLNNFTKKGGFNIPSMYQGGHRQMNHDLMSAMIKGYQVAGYAGMRAAFYHLMGDVVSDNMARRVGTDKRDAIESMWLDRNKVPKYNFEQ